MRKPRSLNDRFFLGVLGVLAVLFALPACTKNFQNENDKLRARVCELEPALAAATLRAETAEQALQHHLNTAAPTSLPEGCVPSLLAGVEFAAYTRGHDTDADGRDDAARLYLNTFDQRRRFTQATATVDVTLSAVIAGQPPVTLATHHFDATTWTDAYRSGITGTHYTLTVPFTAPLPQGVQEITVSLELTDLLSGAKHKAEKIAPVTNP